jgi:acyl-CoA hydrolase
MALITGKEDIQLGSGISIVQHLVKSEDLNHHRTLYAGRAAEWFVETGFIAAASLLPPSTIVCLKIHGFEFLRPAHAGEIASFTGKVVLTGKTSLVTFIRMEVKGENVVEGFITFIHVDENGKAVAHGLNYSPETEEETALSEKARTLTTARKV